MENKPVSLEHLATRNDRIVRQLYGDDFVELSLNNALDPKTVVDANHALAEFLYGIEIARIVRERDFEQLNERYVSNLDVVTAPQKMLDEVDLDEIGVVVIRPEIVEIVDQCISLVEKNNLHIIYEKPLEISFEQYWGLYHHGLSDPASYQDFPTRTLNYANKPCHLLILGREQKHSKKIPLSEIITQTLKGTQGANHPGTIRGGITYAALKGFVSLEPEPAFVDGANIALDPIGAYRHLVNGTIDSDRAHVTADNPLLFYAGQGAHIPNGKEIDQDLRILCTSDELESLIAGSYLPRKTKLPEIE